MSLLEPSLALAFAAGVVTFTTPCILPLLPGILAGSAGSRIRPLLIVLGFAVTFTIMGGLFSAVGFTASTYNEYLRLISVFFIIGFGVVLIDDGLRERFSALSSRVLSGLTTKLSGKKGVGKKDQGSLGAFFLGMSLGVVWIPCVGPILGSILAFVTLRGNVAFGSLMLFVYSIGLGLPILAVAYTGRYSSSRLSFFKKHNRTLLKAAGFVLVVLGILILFEVDKLIQTALLPYFPEFETILAGMT